MKFMIFGTSPVGLILSVAVLLLVAGLAEQAIETAEFGNDVHEFEEVLGLINTQAGETDFLLATAHLSEYPQAEGEMTTPLAIKLGVFPSNLVEGDKAHNRWGGSIIVDHTPQHLMYLYTDKLPKEACRAVISLNSAGFQYVGVDWKDMTNAKAAMDNCTDGDNTLVLSYDPQYSLELLQSLSSPKVS